MSKTRLAYDITVLPEPGDAVLNAITIKNSDDKVAEISAKNTGTGHTFVVKALSEGTTTITASAKDEAEQEYTAACIINEHEKKPETEEPESEEITTEEEQKPSSGDAAD